MRERRNSARVLLHKSIEHDRKKKKRKLKKKKIKNQLLTELSRLSFGQFCYRNEEIDQEKS